MLKKNVYIIFPTGYSGNYVRWGIHISDQDLAKDEPNDPINRDMTKSFGGPGSSHFSSHRLPTHHVWDKTMIWMVLNKPQTPLVYVLNVLPTASYSDPKIIAPRRDNVDAIYNFMAADRDGIFINIHDNRNFDTIAYGAINSATKWPFKPENRLRDIGGLYEGFDPFNCAHDIRYRNAGVEGEGHGFHTPNHPIDWDALRWRFHKYEGWFKQRNKYHPHEVNEQYYVNKFETENRIFEFSCVDVVSENFPDILENIMKTSDISDNWNLDYLRKFHHNYIEAQPNLQWFESFDNWKETGELDEYLLSHGAIQAQLIKYMLLTAAEKIIGWENMSIEEINEIYQN